LTSSKLDLRDDESEKQGVEYNISLAVNDKFVRIDTRDDDDGGRNERVVYTSVVFRGRRLVTFPNRRRTLLARGERYVADRRAQLAPSSKRGTIGNYHQIGGLAVLKNRRNSVRPVYDGDRV